MCLFGTCMTKSELFGDVNIFKDKFKRISQKHAWNKKKSEYFFIGKRMVRFNNGKFWRDFWFIG